MEAMITTLKHLHRKLNKLHTSPNIFDGKEVKLERYLDRLVGEIPVAIYYYDLHGRFVYGNKKAEEICGYKREELIGKHYFNAGITIILDLFKMVKILTANLMGTGTGPDEFTVIRKDGSRRQVEVKTRLINLNKRKLVVCTAIDVTEKKEITSICSHCHSIKDEKGNWNPLTEYFTQIYNVRFSHGICPECRENYY